MKRLHPSRWALTTAVCAALLVNAADAQATLYELSWAYKWGSGDIIFDGSVPDSNPDPNRADHFGSIVSYDLLAWTTSLEPISLVGTSGAISVQNGGPDVPATLTFQLGSAAPPFDPAGWQLSLLVPLVLGNFFDHLPTNPMRPGPCGSGPGTCDEFSWYSFGGGVLTPNTPDGQSYIPIMDGDSQPVTFKALASSVPPAVPEPATIALLGLGLAVLVAAARKRLVV